MAGNQQQTYEDFEPPVESTEEDGCSILNIYLPGFSKERLRVQVSSSGKIRISGERPYRNNKWQRFQKEFQIPPNCEANKITAKYKGGILHVRQPLREAPTKEKQPNSETETETKEEEGETKSEKERNETTYDHLEENAGKADADMRNKIMSAAGRLKEAVESKLMKWVLVILVAMLLFLYAQRQTPCPTIHNES